VSGSRVLAEQQCQTLRAATLTTTSEMSAAVAQAQKKQ
jgi:hypothetical protein